MADRGCDPRLGCGIGGWFCEMHRPAPARSEADTLRRQRDRATDQAERALAERDEARGALRHLLAALSGEGPALEAIQRAWRVLGC